MEIEGCLLPEDRLYDLELDVWWASDADHPELARVGLIAPLTAFAGPFRSLQFRTIDGMIGRGRSVATVESVRYTGAVRLPVDATILERNEAVVERPRLLNDAPYGDGWVVRARAEHPGEAGDRLETATAIAGRIEERIRTQRIRCWPQTPDIDLYEIGLECSTALTNLNEELGRRKPGDAIVLVTDDPTSPIEMTRWADQTGHSLLAHRRDGELHHFLVRKEPNPVPRRRRA